VPGAHEERRISESARGAKASRPPAAGPVTPTTILSRESPIVQTVIYQAQQI